MYSLRMHLQTRVTQLYFAPVCHQTNIYYCNNTRYTVQSFGIRKFSNNRRSSHKSKSKSENRKKLHGNGTLLVQSSASGQYSDSLLDKVLTKHEVPNESEIVQLKNLFKAPRQLVHSLLQPLIDGNRVSEPAIDFSQRMKGKIWKARLVLEWPQKITVTAVHRTPEVAIDHAYLVACKLLQDIGLIQGYASDCRSPVTQEMVLCTLQTLGKIVRHTFRPKPNFNIKSMVQFEDTSNSWKTDLQVLWPCHFKVSGYGSTLGVSQLEACLMANIKLKTAGLLSCNNILSSGKVMQLKNSSPNTITRENFQPDFEIYVDASQIGFGAYLLNQEDNKVSWLADKWPSHFNTRDVLPIFDSGFFEFYALVTACYTWKHKFNGKKILCWCDNLSAVMLVNQGLYIIPETKFKKYEKLYKILYDTCQKYNLTLHAAHVHRIDNVAADHLSRCRVDKFREIIPRAQDKSKKTKKLLFCHPLVKEIKPKNKDDDS